MNNTQCLKLIEGSFTHNDAKEILWQLFSSKLNFHNLKNWSSNERFGKDDELAQKRIPALKREMERLQEILSEAKAHNKLLVVDADIKIVLQDVNEPYKTTLEEIQG